MSFKESLVFEIACCEKELEDATKKVKTLRKRLKNLNDLLNEIGVNKYLNKETDNPYNPKEDVNG